MSTAAGTRRPLTKDIRAHYDRLSPLYRRFWGEHLHHGYWENGESVKDAQQQLVRRLAGAARIKPGSRVLDVGCGLGGSSIWLARNLGCAVDGVTISPAQEQIASRRVRSLRLSPSVRFQVADAEQMAFPTGLFDVVWVIESSEHFHDKARFIKRCHQALKPNGVLALCAWIDRGDSSGTHRDVISRIEEGMICPSLARMEDYEGWMRESGFSDVSANDISDRVAKTWDLCAEIAQRRIVKALVRTMDGQTRRFVDAFVLMQQAYRSRILGYGMLTAFRAP